MTSNVNDVARKIVIRLCRIWFQQYKILFLKVTNYRKIARNIYSHTITGLSHWNPWILSLVVISTDARKLASFDIPTRDNIHRYNCNNPIFIFLRFVEVWTQRVTCKVSDALLMLTLHGTRCVHTSMNLRKMKFISYIYTLFLDRFCSLFVEFWFKSCK